MRLYENGQDPFSKININLESETTDSDGMNSIPSTGIFFQNSAHKSPVQDDINYSSASQTRVSTSQTQQQDITIYTAEGDKVTLSSHAASQQIYTLYNSTGRTDEQSFKLQNESYFSETNQEMSISIEGDLNARELKDIHKAVKAINKVMKSFIAGDMEQVASAISKVDHKTSGLKSISSLEADLQIEHSLSQQQFSTQLSSLDAGASSGTLQNEIASIEQVGRLTDDLIGIIQDSGTRPLKMINPINKLLSGLKQQIPDKDANRRAKLDILHHIPSILFGKFNHPGQSLENSGFY